MAEKVEVVVKIPKYYLTHPQDYSCLAECVRRGVPLPKGHGELVDRNAINERFDSIYSDAINCSNQPSDKYLLDKLSMCLDTALPIIGAETEDA